MPLVPSIAQSGGRRIAVSVKILEAVHASYVMSIEQSRDISHIQKQGTEMALPQKNLHPTTAQWAFRELHEKENEHCIRWLSPRRSNAGGDGRNAIILPRAPRKSRSGAPASGVNARRSLDCAAWADCGERGRWDWTERRSGTPRFRCAIFNLLRPATKVTKVRDSGYRACNRAVQIQPGLRC